MIAPSIAFIIFSLGYLLIALEAQLRVSKSAWALLLGGVLWGITAIAHPEGVSEEMLHVGYDIFSLVVFLLAAMSLVEILIHYRLFDVIRARMCALGLTNKQQFAALSGISFVLSAIIDNLTTTIVMVQIARRFFKGDALVMAAAAIVVAANAGGAFSPIGDVTTIMLWIAHKFEAMQVIGYGLLPSLALLGVVLAWFIPKIKNVKDDTPPEAVEPLTRGEKLVITIALGSFILPVIAKTFGLPPVVGILFGVALTWVVVDLIKRVSRARTHLTASIEHLLQKTDLSSLEFFIGILLAVGALGALGVLDTISSLLYGADPSTMRVVAGSVLLGLLSAVLDNIPLTAIAIDILPVTDPALWVLLALTVGTGGSLLVIGSAAGVMAMGMVPELTFGRYVRLAFLPALLGFIVCIGVWGIEYAIFG